MYDRDSESLCACVIATSVNNFFLSATSKTLAAPVKSAMCVEGTRGCQRKWDSFFLTKVSFACKTFVACHKTCGNSDSC
jgi:hypothetical protein